MSIYQPLSKNSKKIIISFHDFHSGSMAIYDEFYKMLNDIGFMTVSVLAVPQMHFGESLSENSSVADWLLRMQEIKNDICLHGFYHKVNKVHGGILSQIIGNFYTNKEGEFFNLDAMQAREKLLNGLKIFNDIGLFPRGFTPPAWLISKDALAEVKKMRFDYITTYSGVNLLTNDIRIKAPVLVLSSRGILRRFLSKNWLNISGALFNEAEILRFALHPPDIIHKDIRKKIIKTFQALAKHRMPMTYQDLLEKNNAG
jgi:predicted deacetylase